jgi:pilus assembly protein CpaD
MSSNRPARIIRTVLAICAAASLAACANEYDHKFDASGALTPTEQFAIKVAPHEDQIMLAPHPEGISPGQSAALADLVDRWRDAGSGSIKIQAPAHGGEDAFRSVAMIQDALLGLGVAADQIHLVDYDAGLRPRAPIIVAYTQYEAKGPVCGRDWESYTHSAENNVNSNFGCATTANVAAQLANAGDLIAPRDSQPADPGRRATVFAKYRKGEVTSSAKDSQAAGVVSNIGQ